MAVAALRNAYEDGIRRPEKPVRPLNLPNQNPNSVQQDQTQTPQPYVNRPGIQTVMVQDPAASYPLPQFQAQASQMAGQAAEQAVAVAKSEVANWVFWSIMSTMPITLGLSFPLFDIAWGVGKFFGMEFLFWQKVVIVVINLIALFAFFAILAGLFYFICTGYTGVLIKVVGFFNKDYSFCSALNN